ncbi:MAG: hypothetical protein WBD01_15060 [Salaquimonas sp.]
MVTPTFEAGPQKGSISPIQEIEGQTGPAKFRYSRAGFRRNLVIALALTALICGLVWLLLGISGSNHMTLYTSIAGLLFFAFISAKMLGQYVRNEVVLAVQPTGLYDSRISSETIAWDKIKELVLLRREQEYSLSVHLWPKENTGDAKAKSHEIELTALEGGSEKILEAINQYKPIRLDR